jgi:NhaP-type Na+/H+ or K+/H+ antiporter
VIFGAAVVGKYLDNFTWEVVVYAVMSLTVVRMVPVLVSLAGSPLLTDEKLFVSWFGPRGLASVVFGVIVLNAELPGGGVVALTVVCTILLSVLGHGLSANPLIAALAGRAKRG